MKSLRQQKWFFFLLLNLVSLFGGKASAQLPQCGNNIAYAISGYGVIYNWNVTQPFSSTNPSFNTIAPPIYPSLVSVGLDLPAWGLAVGPNINSATGPALTFYSLNITHVDTSLLNTQWYPTYNTYIYYNGSSWVDTWHKAHGGVICAGGGYIFDLDDTGAVFRYDGTGDDVFLTTVAGFTGGPMGNGGQGVAGLAADCQGNFYTLSVSDGIFQKHSPDGVLLQTWGVTGNNLANIFAGGGMTIIGDTIYFTCQNQIFRGVIGATNVNISLIAPYGTTTDSFLFTNGYASCALKIPSTVPPNISDTIYICKDSLLTILPADNSGPPYSYSFLNGNAPITGSGPSYKVSATNAAFTLKVNSLSIDPCNLGAPLSHTVTVVPAPKINAGSDISIFGCLLPHEATLSASLSNVYNGVNYDIQWSPAATISSGANTLTPSISPTASTNYYLTVTAPSSKGGCVLKDSVFVKLVMVSTVKDLNAGEDIDIKPGEHVQLHGTAWGDFYWTPDAGMLSPGSLTPTVHPEETTTYLLTGKTSDGCPATDSVTVHTTLAIFPNAFSPNGDGLNDEFKVYPIDGRVKLERFSIYNRWGQEVFMTQDISKGWNGTYNNKMSDAGTYFYQVIYVIGSKEYSYKGDITLIK
jgi:gliding motility-associated-like protein